MDIYQIFAITSITTRNILVTVHVCISIQWVP